MKKTVQIFLFLPILALFISPENSSAVTKVSRTLNAIEFFGGSALPHGEYNGMAGVLFDENNPSLELAADSFLNNSLFLGLNYGALLKGHSLVQLGFRYTHHNVDKNEIQLTGGVDFSYYNLDLDWSYKFYFMDLNQSSFSPFVGGSAQTGFTTLAADGFDTERNFDIALSVNFGADLKVWSSTDGRAYLALSSTNDYNLTSTNNRPKYLDIGVGLKYFFRP